MLFENLRGEMTVSATGAKISLRDSKFIQVVAKSVGVSCKEVQSHRKLKLHFYHSTYVSKFPFFVVIGPGWESVVSGLIHSLCAKPAEEPEPQGAAILLCILSIAA